MHPIGARSDSCSAIAKAKEYEQLTPRTCQYQSHKNAIKTGQK
ncbi:MAG: hypothetical protein ACPGED_02140 [Flavobacteriales bacterium]